MAFLQPWALLGLLAAGIPILLHLLARREPPTVAFPAVRYLLDTTREHARRLRLQHLLLLIVRTLLVIALVLAAAGPTVPLRGVPGHGPTALALIVDDSPSSGAVAGGTPRLQELVSAARAVLDRATPDDRLWLVTAGAPPLAGDVATLRARLDALAPSATRLDLGAAVRQADALVRADRRPGAILVLSDLQASALSAASPGAPVVVARPASAPPANVGIAAVEPGPEPWGPDGNRVTVRLAGDSGLTRAVTVRAAGRPEREGLGAAGGAVGVATPALPTGWHTLAVALEPDELRADDSALRAVRVAPVARAECASAGRWAEAACEVLRQNGRLAPGAEVAFGRLAGAAAVVLPPEDPALVGALNRDLERRGVAWRYGAVQAGGAVDSGGVAPAGARVQRRLALVPAGSGRSGVLGTVGGAPWLVRSGSVVLLGSRLDPAWTDLPVSAAMVPFVDRLLNRVARGEVAALAGAPGEPVLLPDRVSEVRAGDRRWGVEGGAAFRAPAPGIHWLLAGGDTVGSLSVQVDPREGVLAPAADREVAALWPGAEVVRLGDVPAAAFAAGARGDLRGPLLWLALVLAGAEALLASGRRRAGAAAPLAAAA
ncbi:MAG: BatA and WFA domain-containing protein [Gemmatimonadales bacterium]|nr:BatA and WFA domain-containing protein [Gemmatimonadales bacterium]